MFGFLDLFGFAFDFDFVTVLDICLVGSVFLVGYVSSGFGIAFYDYVARIVADTVV